MGRGGGGQSGIQGTHLIVADAALRTYLLSSCPDTSVREPNQALVAALTAVQQLGEKSGLQQSAHWQHLGVAEYRAGNWTNAIQSAAKVHAVARQG